MIKAVIYDLDDLMVNSDSLHIDASEKVFSRHNVDLKKLPLRVRAGFVGMRVSDILRVIVNYFNLNVDFNQLREERSQLFLDLVSSELKPMPGLIESLKFFKEGGFNIALASSGTRKYIKLVLKKFKIDNYFDVVVSGDDVNLGKPNPETYLVACSKLKIEPAKALVLEDATKGIAAAKSAGCICIGIRNPYTLRQDLSQADLVLNSLSEIDRNVINSLNIF